MNIYRINYDCPSGNCEFDVEADSLAQLLGEKLLEALPYEQKEIVINRIDQLDIANPMLLTTYGFVGVEDL